MAYARWSDGPWYIYWHADSGNTRETQVLFVGLSYGKWSWINPGEAEALLTSDEWGEWPGIEPEEQEEARESFRAWLAEVDEEYPKTAGG